MKKEKMFAFVTSGILTLSSCSILNPNNNFDSFGGLSGCISYFKESFGVEYSKNNIDKDSDFNINVMAGNFYYRDNNIDMYDNLYEEVYFFIYDYNLNNIYKLNLDPSEFASKNWYLNYINDLKYRHFKNKISINLHELITEDYDNYIYIGLKLFNDKYGESFDYHFRYKYTNINYQSMIIDENYSYSEIIF